MYLWLNQKDGLKRYCVMSNNCVTYSEIIPENKAVLLESMFILSVTCIFCFHIDTNIAKKSPSMW
jgi:hypothetical protein